MFHEGSVEMNKNMVKNTASNKQFRTRFIYASKHKVTHVETLLAIPKQKAIHVGHDALKRTQVKVQTKTRIPWVRKVSSPGTNNRSYAEVVFMMRRAGHSVINYIDDYVGFGIPSDAKSSYDHLYDLLDRLGLTISQKKLVPPSTSVICLGVEIDIEKGSISIPQKKLCQICDTVCEWKNKKILYKAPTAVAFRAFIVYSKMCETCPLFLE